MVHCFSIKDINVILDCESGSVHLADPVSFELCGLLSPPLSDDCPQDALFALEEKYGEDAIEEAYRELLALYQAGELFTEPYDGENARKPLYDAPVKAVCLHVSHDCNMRCKYCFAKTGDFGTTRSIMNAETAKAAIDFVVRRSGKRRNIEIDFFGGEPLMALDTVKETVEYARSLEKEHNKNFRFTITTNGLLLNDEAADYINREMSNVVLSLDGRKDINDNVRKTVSGDGTFDLIIPKMQHLVKLREKDKDYYVRGTFTKDNLDFTQDIKEMVSLGFRNLSVEPVVLPKESPLAIGPDDLPRIFEEYETFCEYLLENQNTENEFLFFHFMIDLEQGPCILKRMRGCGAGFEYVAITPEGDIYPCHQFVGNEDFKMGSLFDDTFDMEVSRRFSSINISTRKGCSDCWAKYYCGGGCSAANYNMNGKIDEPYQLGCELERKRVECAIYIKAKQMLSKSN